MKKIIFALLLCSSSATIANPAAEPNFTGEWESKGEICKYACTKEDPEPDFTITSSLTLIQRGSKVCGVHSQNNLADNIYTRLAVGMVNNGKLKLNFGESVWGEEPAFPIKVTESELFILKNNHLVPIIKYKEEEIASTEGQYVLMPQQELDDAYSSWSEFFRACFESENP